MAKIGRGGKKALLVIDAQNGVLKNAYDRDAVVANIEKVVRKARLAKVPIVFVQHCSDDELPENSPQWRIAKELTVANGDDRVSKRYNSAFENTELDAILEKLGIAELLVTGAATNWCVRATSFGALGKGYDLTLVSDAHTTEDMELASDRIIRAKDIISEFNIGIKYVEYPDRTTRVVSADELVL